MAKTVIGIFRDSDDAESAIKELQNLGYDPKNISVIMKDIHARQRIADNTSANVAGGAATGIVTGGVLGALAGLLVGVGAIAIPGLGGLLVGGPLAATLGLTGAAASTATGAATGIVAGGLIGALMGLGIPREQAQYYEEQIRGGGILLAVPTMERRVDEVREIMEEFRAVDVRQLDLPDVDSLDQRDNRSHYHSQM